MTSQRTIASLLFRLIAFAVLLLSQSDYAFADQDSLEMRDEILILSITNIDPGGYKDTIKGSMSSDGQVIPRSIAWGVSDTTRSARTTKLEYPRWKRLRFSLSIQDLNNDSLSDLIFMSAGLPKDRTKKNDSLRAIVLFGQTGLDSLSTIAIATVGAGLRSWPFFSLELDRGNHLRYPQQRDLSGSTSYILPRLSVGRNRDSTPPPIVLSPDEGRVLMRVAPNPTSGFAVVTADVSEPALYSLTVLAVNGSVCHQSQIEVGTVHQLADEIDLRRMPAGYYVVILEARGKRVGVYPFVIVH